MLAGRKETWVLPGSEPVVLLPGLCVFWGHCEQSTVDRLTHNRDLLSSVLEALGSRFQQGGFLLRG